MAHASRLTPVLAATASIVWTAGSNTDAHVASPASDTHIHSVAVAAANPPAAAVGDGNNAFPQWSPDGRKLLFASDSDGVGKAPRSEYWSGAPPPRCP